MTLLDLSRLLIAGTITRDEYTVMRDLILRGSVALAEDEDHVRAILTQQRADAMLERDSTAPGCDESEIPW